MKTNTTRVTPAVEREHVTPGAGERVRRLRKGARYSQRELGELVGVTQASMSNYESGKREMPLSLAVRLAAVFDVDVCKLVTD